MTMHKILRTFLVNVRYHSVKFRLQFHNPSSSNKLLIIFVAFVLHLKIELLSTSFCNLAYSELAIKGIGKKLTLKFQVDKKRHLGNDIVAIVFQDSNTPFCPTLMKTKVTHAYVVVQPMEIDGPTQYKVKPS